MEAGSAFGTLAIIYFPVLLNDCNWCTIHPACACNHALQNLHAQANTDTHACMHTSKRKGVSVCTNSSDMIQNRRRASLFQQLPSSKLPTQIGSDWLSGFIASTDMLPVAVMIYDTQSTGTIHSTHTRMHPRAHARTHARPHAHIPHR